MSLRATIQQAVKAGFAAMGDIPEAITYKAAGAPGYDPTSGAPSVTYIDYAASAVFDHYAREELDRAAVGADAQAIRPEDQKCLIPRAGFAPIPTLNDKILRGTELWSVISIRTDPAGALWELQVRRP